MIRLVRNTMVLVLDGEKALFLRNDGDAVNPHLVVVGKEEQENPPDHEQSTDRPGRMLNRGVGQRTAMEETDWHELAKERFADDMAAKLLDMARRGRLERLVVVAPPKILGELRSKLHRDVADRVIGEIPKTLTKHPVDQIVASIRAHLET